MGYRMGRLMDDLLYASATKMAAAIRAKQVSSAELVEAHLRRIEEVNPMLNAVVVSLADRAREEARQADAATMRGDATGPLRGVPTTVKEAWESAGIPCTGGTLGRKGFIGARDSTVVARLRAAGAIPLGMTNTPEFSMAFESDNLVYGRTNNPYDLSRTPGGSGGGGAAIIAAGGSPWEIGADLGGSIRLPAHFSGIAGIKPTVGRVPMTGYFPPSLGFVQMFCSAGPMARYVEDLALTLRFLVGPDGIDTICAPVPLGDPAAVDVRKLRVAFHTDNGIVAASAETAQTVRRAAESLSDAGAVVEEARPEGIEQAFEIFLATFTADGGSGLRHLLNACGTTEIHPLLQGLLSVTGSGFTPAMFGGLLARVSMWRMQMLALMARYDVILAPVNAFPALKHGATVENLAAFSYTMAYNLTGWPGAVVRCGTSQEGLPIGVQAVAQPWREEVALAVVRHLETAFGGWQRPDVAHQAGA
jgi:amidase